MVALAVEVTAGVVFRYAGYSLVWYDEVATILLAWVTFYGSALAVLKHAHMGVPEIVRHAAARRCAWRSRSSRKPARSPSSSLLAWAGYSVLEILATDYLVSLPRYRSRTPTR